MNIDTSRIPRRTHNKRKPRAERNLSLRLSDADPSRDDAELMRVVAAYTAQGWRDGDILREALRALGRAGGADIPHTVQGLDARISRRLAELDQVTARLHTAAERIGQVQLVGFTAASGAPVPVGGAEADVDISSIVGSTAWADVDDDLGDW